MDIQELFILFLKSYQFDGRDRFNYIEKSKNLFLLFVDPVQERRDSHVNARNSLHTASCFNPA
jgi:hypothetical protein